MVNSAPPPQREDLITKGVSFLADRSLTNSPMSQKMAHLEKQGMNPQEIMTTLHRLQVSQAGSSMPGSWMWNALIGVAMVGAGYVAYELSTGEEEYPAAVPVPVTGEEGEAGAEAWVEAGAEADAEAEGEGMDVTEGAGDDLQRLLSTGTGEPNSVSMNTDADTFFIDGDDVSSNTRVAVAAAAAAAATTTGAGAGAAEQWPSTSDIALEKLQCKVSELSSVVDAAVKLIHQDSEKDGELPDWAEVLTIKQKRVTRDLQDIRDKLNRSVYALDLEALDTTGAGKNDAAGNDESTPRSSSSRSSTYSSSSSAAKTRRITQFFMVDADRPKRTRRVFKRQVKEMTAACAEAFHAAKEEEEDSEAAAASTTTTDADDADNEALGPASATLTMYLKNIVNNPEVPRYHKISINNAAFKKSVAPVPGHVRLFESVGFTRVGNYFEWIGIGSNTSTSSLAATTSTGSLPATVAVASAAAQKSSGKDDSGVAVGVAALDSEERKELLQLCIDVLKDMQVMTQNQKSSR